MRLLDKTPLITPLADVLGIRRRLFDDNDRKTTAACAVGSVNCNLYSSVRPDGRRTVKIDSAESRRDFFTRHRRSVEIERGGC